MSIIEELEADKFNAIYNSICNNYVKNNQIKKTLVHLIQKIYF